MQTFQNLHQTYKKYFISIYNVLNLILISYINNKTNYKLKIINDKKKFKKFIWFLSFKFYFINKIFYYKINLYVKLLKFIKAY